MFKPFPDGSAPPLVHVGRRPVHDRSGAVVAYRLLFRDTAPGAVASSARTTALTQLIVTAFTEFGISELAGSLTCLVTVNRDFLTGAVPLPFAPGQVVLAVDEPFPLDDEAVAGGAALAGRGFPLAVDAFTWGTPQERLLPFAGYVTLDLRGADRAAADDARRRLSAAPGVRMIAGHLETAEQFDLALELGFELFEGPAVGRVRTASRPALSPAAASRLQLIALLSGDDVGIDEVTDAVAEDPAVSYRLLHAAGAAASGQISKVASLREAVVLLGLDRIQGWVTLMLLSDGATLDAYRASVVLGRARFCRNLAPMHDAPPDAAFTVGLLSGLADVLGVPAAELIVALPLADALVAALVDGDGPLGATLRTAVRYSEGRVERLPGALGPRQLIEAQLGAFRWTNRLLATAA
ncbi:EAL and HDOD domain-containing protein [Cryptosporangium aurantiacum]|uniref:EAL and modified HD-GYP domain-containing signal transduction protein n=1 Tax=Cryptosporangium aurantiacum TaxID=134849 RepID=A0A1M7TV85_9ACTN|nr:HDOD domain-containing protein [Cryptosporangium aurantiacum]SHN74598.1 EAL and modified HD-GYP domain-containing signal transduction protein [Cryptosporangium aurantiacum]